MGRDAGQDVEEAANPCWPLSLCEPLKVVRPGVSCMHDTNGEQVAVKAIIGKKLNAKLRENLECEIRILKDFKHPNIVGYMVWIKHRQREFIFLVMEFCDGGDVHQYLQDGRLDEYVVPFL